jgi:outer membrane protein TolC
MKSGYKFILSLLFLGSCSYPVCAQETVLTKQEALKQALQSNYGIRLSENEVEIAENDQSILNSGYLPTVTGRASATYDINDRTTDPEGRERIERRILKINSTMHL